ncbi:MAG: helix-turn-helix domain-containing protein [Spirochaetia bacterium]
MPASSLTVYRAFGRRLRDARRKAGMTQARLAKAVEISRTSITNIEAGRQPVYLHLFMRLAEVLGLAGADLLPTSTETEPSGEMTELLSGLPSDTRDWINRVISSPEEGGPNAAEILARKTESLGPSGGRRRTKDTRARRKTR